MPALREPRSPRWSEDLLVLKRAPFPPWAHEQDVQQHLRAHRSVPWDAARAWDLELRRAKGLPKVWALSKM